MRYSDDNGIHKCVFQNDRLVSNDDNCAKAAVTAHDGSMRVFDTKSGEMIWNRSSVKKNVKITTMCWAAFMKETKLVR